MGILGNITLAMKSRDPPQKNQPHEEEATEPTEDLAEEEAEIKAVRHDTNESSEEETKDLFSEGAPPILKGRRDSSIWYIGIN